MEAILKEERPFEMTLAELDLYWEEAENYLGAFLSRYIAKQI